MIAILDFGSQYTQLIARRIRESRVYCEIHPYNLDPARLRALEPAGVILSGGPSSVYDDDAPHPHPDALTLDVPYLGICYGMGVLARAGGGEMARSTHREYGGAALVPGRAEELFAGLTPGESTRVWMSHADRLEHLPAGWTAVASTTNSPYAAIRSEDGRRFGLQFHPEVVHSEQGRVILENFLHRICRIESDWTMEGFVDSALERIRAQVGDGHVVCGLSGGVDSSVTAALIEKAVPGQLTCVFVDNGLLRKNEAREVCDNLGNYFGADFVHVDASNQFLDALAEVVDPERKRKIIGSTFIDVFDEAARSAHLERRPARFLAQGTLYPDVIESVSVKGPSATIKSHHNVGGLPADLNMELVEPLRDLFKDEVRVVGRQLDLPSSLVDRQPFPGPGLAVRCLGEVTEEKLRALREADAIVREEIEARDLHKKLWQYFAVLLPVKSVGVMGDARTYENACAIRVVSSQDAMTADWELLPVDVLRRISNRIINEVKGLNRVTLDISSKPPATIEWE